MILVIVALVFIVWTVVSHDVYLEGKLEGNMLIFGKRNQRVLQFVFFHTLSCRSGFGVEKTSGDKVSWLFWLSFKRCKDFTIKSGIASHTVTKY